MTHASRKLEAIQRYHQMGWTLVGMPLCTKSPIHPGWQFGPPPGQRLRDDWDGNVGLLHGLSGTCAVDIDNVNLTRTWMGFHQVNLDYYLENHDKFPQITSHQPNRAKLIFKLPNPRPSAKHTDGGKDILNFRCTSRNGNSVQDVLPPSIHPDFCEYTWIGNPIDLPTLPEELENLWNMLSPPVAAGNTESIQVDFDVEAALAFLDPDTDMLTWVRMGMAVHAIDPGLYDVWHNWSMKGVKYRGEQDCQARWASFNEPGQVQNPVGPGTLLHAAIKAGFNPHKPPTFDNLLERQPITDLERLEGEVQNVSVRDMQGVNDFLFRLQAVDLGTREVILQRVKDRLRPEGLRTRALDEMMRFQARRYRETMQAQGEHMPQINPQTGTPLDHVANVRWLLKKHQIRVQHNTMDHSIRVNWPGRQWSRTERQNEQIWRFNDLLVEHGMSRLNTREHLFKLALESEYHPFLEWLRDGPKWDGTKRLHRIFDALPVAKGKKGLRNMLVFKWMLGGIAGVRRNESYTVDTNKQIMKSPPRGVLVLAGPQTIGKTSFFRYLCPRDMFGEGMHLDPHDKDSVAAVTRNFITELGELDSTLKRDLGMLKAFLTREKDVIRLPYAPRESEWPRQTLFAGTVNNPEYLKDQTGNTRFYTVEVVDTIDLDTVRLLQESNELQQIWREVEYWYDNGEEWSLDQNETALLERSNEMHRQSTYLEELIEDCFDWDAWDAGQFVHMKLLEIAKHIEVPLNRGGDSPQLRHILRKRTNMQRQYLQRDGKRGWFWQMPPPLHGPDNVITFKPITD